MGSVQEIGNYFFILGMGNQGMIGEFMISWTDNHIKGTSEHTMRMDLMICLGKNSNPTQEGGGWYTGRVRYE